MMIALGYELPMIRYDTSCLNCARCLTLYLLPQPSLFPVVQVWWWGGGGGAWY